jgi:hypothetical protein
VPILSTPIKQVGAAHCRAYFPPSPSTTKLVFRYRSEFAALLSVSAPSHPATIARAIVAGSATAAGPTGIATRVVVSGIAGSAIGVIPATRCVRTISIAAVH